MGSLVVGELTFTKTEVPQFFGVNFLELEAKFKGLSHVILPPSEPMFVAGVKLKGIFAYVSVLTRFGLGVICEIQTV